MIREPVRQKGRADDLAPDPVTLTGERSLKEVEKVQHPSFTVLLQTISAPAPSFRPACAHPLRVRLPSVQSAAGTSSMIRSTVPDSCWAASVRSPANSSRHASIPFRRQQLRSSSGSVIQLDLPLSYYRTTRGPLSVLSGFQSTHTIRWRHVLINGRSAGKEWNRPNGRRPQRPLFRPSVLADNESNQT